MIKYYLIPKEGDGKSTETAFRPKYIRGLVMNNVVNEVPGKDMYMVAVNTRFPERVDMLEKLPGVNKLDNNNQLSRKSLKLLLNVEANDSEDIVEKVGKICQSDFVKESFSVSTD